MSKQAMALVVIFAVLVLGIQWMEANESPKNYHDKPTGDLEMDHHYDSQENEDKGDSSDSETDEEEPTADSNKELDDSSDLETEDEEPTDSNKELDESSDSETEEEGPTEGDSDEESEDLPSSDKEEEDEPIEEDDSDSDGEEEPSDRDFDEELEDSEDSETEENKPVENSQRRTQISGLKQTLKNRLILKGPRRLRHRPRILRLRRLRHRPRRNRRIRRFRRPLHTIILTENVRRGRIIGRVRVRRQRKRWSRRRRWGGRRRRRWGGRRRRRWGGRRRRRWGGRGGERERDREGEGEGGGEGRGEGGGERGGERGGGGRRRSRCRTTFHLRRCGHVFKIGHSSGVLRIRKSLQKLPQNKRDGIRRKTLNVHIHKKCFYRRTRFRTRIIKLIILPSGFGDSDLSKFDPSRVHASKLSKNRKSPSTLHRIFRHESPKMERMMFNEMMAAIRVDRGIEFAINRVLKRVLRRTAIHKELNQDERPHGFSLNGVALHWSLNTLFSSKALQNLAKKSKCTPRREVKCQLEGKYRTIDGTCNNVINPLFGSAPRILNRLVPAKYFDFEKLNEPIGFPGQHLVPSIPETFKVVGKFIRPQPKPSRKRLTNSHLLMQFGQFLDHDVGISLESESSDECQEMKNGRPVRNFEVPCYTIQGFGQSRALPFARSASECQIRNGRYTRREQLNSDTSFVDASQVYGSTDELAERLRENKGKGGKGLLATSNGVNGRFLPINTEELEGPVNLCNNKKSGGKCFLSGDVRTNEQPGLASMHTLFVREHNRIARELSKINPTWKNEKLYQEARKILGAVWQKMTYVDFLPIIIGETLPPYPGYNPNVNADLTNGFSTAAFRFGHTLIRPAFDVLDANFNPIMNPLPLREMFFNTSFIIKRGIDPILLGLLGNSSERFDRKLANDLLQHLFQEPGSSEGGLNLAALNVQRGREHGLPGYNAYRRFCGLRNARNFQATRREIRNGWNRILLRRLYKKPSIADLWIAGLAEAPANGGIVGATFGCIIREQFRRLRDGDSFFYRRPGVFTAEQLIEIEKVTMSRILCDNLKKIVSIQRNAFLAGGGDVRRVECSNIPGINFNVWKESAAPKPPPGGGNRLSIYIRSESAKDPGRHGNGRAIISVNNKDHSKHKRGYNIVVVDGRKGTVESSVAFDTFASKAECRRMVHFLGKIQPEKFVFVAIQSEGSRRMTCKAYRALERIGARIPFTSLLHHSFALLGWSGHGTHEAVAQVRRRGGEGPSIIAKVVPFTNLA